MTASDLRAEADRRIDDAVTEGLDQLAKGWRTREVLAVLKDAAAIVADLLEQADEAEAAAAYGHMIGADLSLDERRLRGQSIARFRPRLTVREHKPERLAGGCRCGLQAGHPDDCEPRVEATA